jgi:aryl carrier-like protein
MIVVGGLKVYPSEVERVLFDCPGVSDCAVVAAPDHTWGEKVAAYIVTGDNGPSEEDVLQHCQQHLATYKVPVHISEIDQLPRNPAGKVLKTQLREKAAEQWPDQAAEVAGTTFTEPGPLIEELQQIHARSRERHLISVIQKEVQSLLGTEHSPEIAEPLLEMGMDSIQIVNLSSRMQTLVGSEMQVPAIIVFDHPTISDLANYLLAALNLDPDSQESEKAVPTSHSIIEEKKTPSISVSVQNAKAEIEEMTEEEALKALQQELSD